MPGPCPECGYPVADGDEFCQNPGCGAYLGWAADGQRRPSAPRTEEAPGRAEPGPTSHVVDLSTDRLDVAPGESADLTVTMTNTGTVVDELTVTVDGPLAPYTRVEPPAVQVYPRDRATTRVTVAPPHAVPLRAGSHPLVLRLVSSRGHRHSEHVGTVSLGSVTGMTARLVPPHSEGRGTRVSTSVEVANRGNTALHLTLSPREDYGRIRWTTVPTTTVEPGATARLAVTGRSARNWLGETEQRPFDVTVHAAPDASTGGRPPPEQRLDGRRDQHAVLAGWRIWLLLAAVVTTLGLLAFLLLGTGFLDGGGQVEAPEEENGQIVMPDLVGADVDSATSALQDAGLEVSVSTQESDEDAGVVLAQDPPPDTPVEPGSTVNLLASSGPSPDAAVCREAAEARQLLDEQGFSDESAQAMEEVVESAGADGVDGTLVELADALSAALEAQDVDTASATVDQMLAVCG